MSGRYPLGMGFREWLILVVIAVFLGIILWVVFFW